MCLILFSIAQHSRYPLIIAANRDESFKRPTGALAFWSDAPNIAAGRDLNAGGTWLGITREGRWAALTNYRQAGSYHHGTPSRGLLVSEYLLSSSGPQEYIEAVQAKGAQYNGFNLLVGTGTEVYYYSNRAVGVQRVPAGSHGLSNHLLNTPWPKVSVGRSVLDTLPDFEPAALTGVLLQSLQSRAVPQDVDLPDTGVGIPGERILSPVFIAAEAYGTRSSTVILVDHNGAVSITEHSFGPHGSPLGSSELNFQLELVPAHQNGIATR